MAQKSQTVSPSEDQANSGSRTSSAKDSAGATSSIRHAANSNDPDPMPASSSILPRMSEPTPISTTSSTPNTGSPQPMEKPPSAAGGAGSQASPYGTRSRNRTGAARPNYAEDRDLELDNFDAYHGQRKDDQSKKTTTTKQPGASSSAVTATASSLASATPAPPRVTNGSSRKPLPVESRQSAAPNGTKDHQQNHDQPSAPPTLPVAAGNAATNGPTKSKKRKVADAASTASGSQTPLASNGTSSTSAAQKRSGASGQASGNGAGTRSGPGYGETNMLTFENCKGRPRDGKMVADNGTVLGVNGEFADSSPHAQCVCVFSLGRF